jgi:hypothetical protein
MDALIWLAWAWMMLTARAPLPPENPAALAPGRP